MANFSRLTQFQSSDRMISFTTKSDHEKILTEAQSSKALDANCYQIDPYIKGVPLDYSFRKVYALATLKNGTPREYRVGIPNKSSKGKFISSSLWINYNELSDLKDLKSLVQVSFNKPDALSWLDVSFNEIQTIPDELLDLANLKILYLHGNQIKYFIEVNKLKQLKLLRTLTLHGNPIETNPNYRTIVTNTLPQLINLDFSLVSK